jgi:hypothetical protein
MALAMLTAGCSTAQSKVDAIAFSNYTFNPAYGVAQPILQSYCDPSTPNDMPLEAAVNAVCCLTMYTVCTDCGGSHSKQYVQLTAHAHAVARCKLFPCSAANPLVAANSCPARLQTINALATAIAETLNHYETYVCSCCIGNSKAYTVVGADVQVCCAP